MKRFGIAVILLIVILGISSYSLWDMSQNVVKLNSSAHELAALDPQTQQELMVTKSTEFVDLWNECEDHMIFYIHHDVLDHVTQLVAELPALARHQEYGLFYAQIDSFVALLDDLWNSALPSYRNLL
ncbi:MAG: DUF4363 family protein [Angelakisella sp.]|nr:DUF4363 family protein [Angelakisella sp.]